MNSLFQGYIEWQGEIPLRATARWWRIAPGRPTGYAIFNLQDAGRCLSVRGPKSTRA